MREPGPCHSVGASSDPKNILLVGRKCDPRIAIFNPPFIGPTFGIMCEILGSGRVAMESSCGGSCTATPPWVGRGSACVTGREGSWSRSPTRKGGSSIRLRCWEALPLGRPPSLISPGAPSCLSARRLKTLTLTPRAILACCSVPSSNQPSWAICRCCWMSEQKTQQFSCVMPTYLVYANINLPEHTGHTRYTTSSSQSICNKTRKPWRVGGVLNVCRFSRVPRRIRSPLRIASIACKEPMVRLISGLPISG